MWKERRRQTKKIVIDRIIDQLNDPIEFNVTLSAENVSLSPDLWHGARKETELELTPSAPLLSFIAVDDDGGLSLTIFVLGYWLGVDMPLFNVHCPCTSNFLSVTSALSWFPSVDGHALFTKSWMLSTKETTSTRSTEELSHSRSESHRLENRERERMWMRLVRMMHDE